MLTPIEIQGKTLRTVVWGIQRQMWTAFSQVFLLILKHFTRRIFL